MDAVLRSVSAPLWSPGDLSHIWLNDLTVNLKLLSRPSWYLLVLIEKLFDPLAPATLWGRFSVFGFTVSTMWQFLIKLFYLHCSSTKKTITSIPLTPFCLWYLFRSSSLGSQTASPAHCFLPSWSFCLLLDLKEGSYGSDFLHWFWFYLNSV